MSSQKGRSTERETETERQRERETERRRRRQRDREMENYEVRESEQENKRVSEIKRAAADDPELTLRNACGILSTQAAYLRALLSAPPPSHDSSLLHSLQSRSPSSCVSFLSAP